MKLILKNKQINGKLEDILTRLKLESHRNLFKDMKSSGDHLMVSCPFHKNGQESHPSCGILQTRKDPKHPFGLGHCFTCGKTFTLPQLISYMLNIAYDEAEDWLIDKFGDDNFDEELPIIDLNNTKNNNNNSNQILNEDILKDYDFYHPYMWERKLTKEITDKFRVGYDKIRNAITFPVWDIKSNLKMVTARSVTTKRFWIPENIDKPVYLLNFIVKEGINTVYVCESQINTLYAWSLGYPAIGLIGTGSFNQYRELRKSGIRNFILCLDGDTAGYKATKRFIENMKNDVIISVVEIPQGKDLNDLSKEEFENLSILDSYDWLEKYNKLIIN